MQCLANLNFHQQLITALKRWPDSRNGLFQLLLTTSTGWFSKISELDGREAFVRQGKVAREKQRDGLVWILKFLMRFFLMNFDHTSDEESGKRSGRMVSIETRSSEMKVAPWIRKTHIKIDRFGHFHHTLPLVIFTIPYQAMPKPVSMSQLGPSDSVGKKMT